MKTTWLIIDGNNLIHEARKRGMVDAHCGFDTQRSQLIRLTATLAGRSVDRMTIVFDGGKQGGRDITRSGGGVEVLFSSAGRTADDVIERMVASHARPQDITVVTSDKAERYTVEGCGASTRSCAAFLDTVDHERGDVRRELARSRGKRRPNVLGDMFPDLKVDEDSQ